MVKEFDEGSSVSVAFALLPGLSSGEGRDAPLEYGIRAAASVARWCRSQAIPFRMWPTPPSDASTHWHDFLDFLAGLDSAHLKDASPPSGLASSDVLILAASPQNVSRLHSFTARSRRRPIALLFQGFDLNDDGPINPLPRSLDIEVVPCPQGGLESSLASLIHLISADSLSPAPGLRP